MLYLLMVTILAVPARGAAQQIMDRIVATVNGAPILQSDCEAQARYEAFVEQKAAAEDETSRQQVLQRVIDQELLRQQMKGGDPAPPNGEVAEKVGEIRRQTPGAKTDEGWQRALAAYGLNEDDLRERVGAQLSVMQFVDRRLRPSVHVAQRDVEDYYRGTFLPELRKRGAGEEPLAEVSARIEEVLAQRAMDQELAAWLIELRKQSTIRMTTQVQAVGQAGMQ